MNNAWEPVGWELSAPRRWVAARWLYLYGRGSVSRFVQVRSDRMSHGALQECRTAAGERDRCLDRYRGTVGARDVKCKHC